MAEAPVRQGASSARPVAKDLRAPPLQSLEADSRSAALRRYPSFPTWPLLRPAVAGD
jgi:hypothetical protein